MNEWYKTHIDLSPDGVLVECLVLPVFVPFPNNNPVESVLLKRRGPCGIRRTARATTGDVQSFGGTCSEKNNRAY